MKRVLKIILIFELILFFIFIFGYLIYEWNYVGKESYGICPNTTYNFEVNESLSN